MRTTLIYPGIAGYGFESVGKGMEAGWISHGLAHLSSAAKAQGFAIDLIDLRALRGWDHFRDEVAARQPDVVGITMMSVDYNPAAQCLDIVKAVNPDIVTVVGGPHPTLALEEVAANDKIDYIITHEGEITFPKLLRAIESSTLSTDRICSLTSGVGQAMLATRPRTHSCPSCRRPSSPSSPAGGASTIAASASQPSDACSGTACAAVLQRTLLPNWKCCATNIASTV
jgi:radical SAM superfamily enzyme YgiQ (UPF0313 family)